MNVFEYLNNNGLKTVPNPEYNPKSKKNNVPPTIQVGMYDDKDPIREAISNSVRNAQRVDYIDIKKYEDYGINYTPEKAASGILDYQLARAQSNFAKIGNALAQTVVSEIVLGTFKGFSDLFDLVGQALGASDHDYSNPATQKLEEWQEAFRNDIAPIHSKPGSGFAGGTDLGWWMQNIPSIASSLTLLIPSNTVMKGVSLLGKAGKATRLGTKAAKTWSKLSRPARARLEYGAKIGLNAGLQRTLENYQEARQTYSESVPEYEEAIRKKMKDGTYDEFLANNAEYLEGVDTSNSLEVAKAIARVSADKTFKFDYANTIFDVVEMMALKNISFGAFAKNTKTVTSRRYDINARKFAGKYKTKDELKKLLDERKVWDKTKDKLGDIGYYAGTTGFAQISEGVEEAINYIAQEEGKHLGRTILGIEADNKTFTRRLKQYTDAPELWESAFWGWMGGITFNAVASAGAKGETAVKRKKYENKLRAAINERTGENPNFANSRAEYFYTADDKRVMDAVDARIAAEAQFSEQMTALNTKGEDPFFKGRIVESEEEKEVLRKKLLEKRRQTLILNAMDSGTIDMLEDYLKDSNVQKAMIDAGIIKAEDVNRLEREDLAEIKKIKEQYKKYKKLVLKAANNIKKDKGVDIPLEYLQLIVRNNISTKLTLDDFNESLARFEQEANELADTLAEKNNNFDKDIDYKTLIKLQVLGSKLGELQAEKRSILEDPDARETYSGKERLKELDRSIATVKDMAYNLQPDNAVANLLIAIEGSLNTKMDDTGKFTEYNDNPELLNFTTAVSKKDVNYFKNLDDRLVDITEDHLNQRQVQRDAFVRALGNKSRSSIATISKELGTAYATIAALEYAIADTKASLVLNDNDILEEAKSINNTLNAIRTAKIEESYDDLKTLADTYGSETIANYISAYLTNPKDVEKIQNINENDADILQTAIDVLNLSAPINSNVKDYLLDILKHHDEAVAAREKNSATVRKPNTSPQTSGQTTSPQGTSNANNGGKNGTTGATTQQNGQQQGSNTTNNSGLYVANIKDNASVSNANSTMDSYTFHATKTNGQYAVSFNLEDKTNYNHYANEDLFIKEDGVSLIDDGSYVVVKLPVIDSNGHVIELGVIGKATPENKAKAEAAINEYSQQTGNTGTSTNPTGNGSATVGGTNTNLPTGVEEPLPEVDDDEPTEAEAELKSKTIDIGAAWNEKLMEIAETENPVVTDEIIDELRKEFNERFNPENSDVVRDAIEEELNKFKKTAEDFELYKPVGAAINASLKAASIPDTDKESKALAEAEFTNMLDRLIEANKSRLGFEHVNGKTYINVESLLRFCNVVTNGSFAAQALYENALRYLQNSSEYVVVDNTPNRILQNIALSVDKRNEISKIQAYSINFDGICRKVLTGNERKQAINEIDHLSIGDSIEYKREDNVIVFYKNGHKIGYLPIPNQIKKGTTDHVMQVNDGWITDINSAGESEFRDLLISWTTNPTNDPDIAELYNTILAYAYEKDEKEKAKLLKTFTNNKAYKEAVAKGFTNDTAFEGQAVNPDEIRLEGLAKLWSYVQDVQYVGENTDIKNRTEQDNIDNRAFGIDLWFDNMVMPSFSFASKLGNTDSGTLTVSDITEGERIETSDDKALSPANALGRRYKTDNGKIDTSKVKVGVTVQGTTHISGNVSINDTALLARTMMGSGNTFVVLIGRNNSHEIVHAYPKKLPLATSHTANSLINAILNEAQRLVEAVDNSDTDKAVELNDLGVFLRKIFGTTTYNPKSKRFYNKFDGLLAPISGVLAVRNIIDSNTKTRRGYELFSNDGIKYSILLNDGKLQILKEEKGVSTMSSLDAALEHMLNANAYINIGTEHIQLDNNRGAINSVYKIDSNTGKFVVEIGTFRKEYESFNDFILNEGFVDLTTKPSDDGYGNHNRFGENGGAIQTIKVKENVSTTATTTPVGSSNNAVDEFTISDTTISDIINSRSTNKGFAIAKALLPFTKISNLYAKLFPKSVIFVNENIGDFCYANTKDHPVRLNDSAGTILQPGQIVITKRWLDELVNSSEAGRKEAVRKLIHENLHLILSDKSNRHYIEDIRKIFNEFARKSKGSNAEDYLFNVVKGHKERYYSHPVLDENGKQKLDEKGNPITEITDEINEEGLEEFLVESLTSKRLANALNNIEADNKEEHKSLFSKLIDFLVKLFDWTGIEEVKKGSLYENQLATINELFGNKTQTTKKEKSKKETIKKKQEPKRPNIPDNQLSLTFEDDFKEENENNSEEQEATTEEENNEAQEPVAGEEVYDEFDDFDDLPAASIRDQEGPVMRPYYVEKVAQSRNSNTSELKNDTIAFLSNFGLSLNDVEQYNGTEPLFDALNRVVNATSDKDITDGVGYAIAFMMQHDDTFRDAVAFMQTNPNGVKGIIRQSNRILYRGNNKSKLGTETNLQLIGNEIAKELRKLYGISITEDTEHKTLFEKIWAIIDKFFGLLSDPLLRQRLTNASNFAKDAANAVKTNDKSFVVKNNIKPGSEVEGEKINIESALKENDYEASIVELMSKNNIALGGSASIAATGTIYRPAENPLHDLDFNARGKTEDEIFSILKSNFNFVLKTNEIYSGEYEGVKEYTATYMVLDREVQEVPIAGTKAVQLIDVNTKEVVGTREFSNLILKDGVQGKMLDFFLGNKENHFKNTTTININGKSYLFDDARNAFKFKIDVAREKDIFDYNRFVPNKVNQNIEIGDVNMFVNQFPISQQARVLDRIDNGEISIKC